MKEDSIKILYQLRSNIDKRMTQYKVVSYFLLGVLIIQGLLLSIANKYEFFAIIGTFFAFIWCIFSIYTMIKLKDDQNNIDEFYLKNSKGD